MASTASAQSVLERVLASLDASTTTPLNGTFANIAENIGSLTASSLLYVDTAGKSYTEAEWAAAQLDIDQGDYANVPVGDYVNTSTGETDDGTRFTTLAAANAAGFIAVANLGDFKVGSGDAAGTVITGAAFNQLLTAASYTVPTLADVISVGLVDGINGSITNTIDGITDVTQTATTSGATAVEYNMPTFDFGDMATTALGAVNTGDITLGVNSNVDNAKTTSTEAVSSVMTQLGGSIDTGTIVLNVASNMTGVNGSITNAMLDVNGSIGNLSTTALGAVNTGTILSGVNAAVTGITGVNGASAGQ